MVFLFRKKKEGKTAEEWFDLGNKEKDPEKKIEYYSKCLELDPKYADAWNNKGFALRESGRYEEALRCFDKAIEIDPEDADAWSHKGVTLHDLGEYEEAIKSLDKFIEITLETLKRDGINWKSANSLIFFRNGRIDDRVLLLFNAWNIKGDALCNLGKYKEAINCHEKALEIAPNSEGTKIMMYKAKVNQWKREGYKVDGLEEMLK